MYVGMYVCMYVRMYIYIYILHTYHRLDTLQNAHLPGYTAILLASLVMLGSSVQ